MPASTRFAEAVQDPHVTATGMVSWHADPALGRVPLVNPPGVMPLTLEDARAAAPRLGEHTAAVLAEIGYPASDIEALKAAGAVA